MEPWSYDPARDIALSRQERAISVKREPTLLELGLQQAWSGFTGAYLRGWHRWQVEGLEHLPERPPYVLIANHTSHLDTIVLTRLVPTRWHSRLFPLAAGDYWFAAGWRRGFATSVLNALPLWRGVPRRHEMKELRDLLVEQEAIFILFPEGTRSRTGAMGEFMPGLGMLVAGTPVPVVPCHLRGCFEACPRGRSIVLPAPIRVRIGAPLRFDESPQTKIGWRETVATVRQAVAHLAQADGPHD